MKSVRLALARSRLSRHIVGLIFEHMSFAIPARRLRETSTLVAFQHPQPAYPVHILLVPKKAISGLEDLSPEESNFYGNLFATIQSLVAEMGLSEQGYQLMVNGGNYQDVPQLHFHLISGSF